MFFRLLSAVAVLASLGHPTASYASNSEGDAVQAQANNPVKTIQPGYFRQPSLFQDTLVFTAEGDIWKTQLGADTATRLTTNEVEEHSAIISPDGQSIAFAANYDGATEIYTMPINGGLAKRVTFENSAIKLHQWHQNGIVYSTNSRVGPTASWVLKTVEPTTLSTKIMPLSDAVEGRLSQDGSTLYFTQFGLQMSNDNANQYKGGAQGELWRYTLGSQQEASLLTEDINASVREPMIKGDTLYFVSNESGLDNVWAMDLDGDNRRQITKFTDWAVRDAMLHGNLIVFQHGADIKVLNIQNQQVNTVDIRLTSDYPNLREKWVNQPLRYLNSARFTEQANKVTLTARGRVAVANTGTQRLVEIATDPTSRTRNAILSNDGEWVYALNDTSGEMEIWQYAADGSAEAKQLTNNSKGFRWNLYPSPDGKHLAHDNKQGEVWLLNLETGEDQLIYDNVSDWSPTQGLVWSQDSSMLAFAHSALNEERSRVLLYSLTDQQHQIVTTEKYRSFAPAFSHDGKWLYFLSDRHFVATPSSPWGDRNMGAQFDRRTQIFALDLTGEGDFPFQPKTELSESASKKKSKSKPKQDDKDNKDKAAENDAENDAENAKQADATDVAEAVTKQEENKSSNIKWQGLAQRLWQVPVESGNYTKLTANRSFLYVLDRVNEPKQQPALKAIQIKPKTSPAIFTTNVADYQLGTKGKSLFIRKRGNGNTAQFIVMAGARFPANANNSRVQTNKWKLAIQPQQEWQQIFRDAWLMHRDSLFDANMRGLDWNATKQKYLPLLHRVTDRHELNDIFKQMMGELNTLHSQVGGGDVPRDTDAPRAASLGATYEDTVDGVKISHIYRHDIEVPSMAAPLSQPGVDAKVGDVITHVNHQAITTRADLITALRNQSGNQVLLTLKREGAENPVSTVVTPVTTSRDFRLRYQDWVVGNATKVAQADDNIGYFHLYAMGGNDISTFAREFYAQYQKHGLIIDVRRNRGGNVDAWILEKLLKRSWSFWQTPNGEKNTNMQQDFRGHIVVLADEFTYSDGETFTAGIKALDLGTVIGKQTAGAGVWLSGRNRVVDNGIARVAEFPVYAMDGRWITEGTGIKPDIRVDNLPFETFQGRDAQLERAIKYLQEKLKDEPIPSYQGLPLPNDTSVADDIIRD